MSYRTLEEEISIYRSELEGKVGKPRRLRKAIIIAAAAAALLIPRNDRYPELENILGRYTLAAERLEQGQDIPYSSLQDMTEKFNTFLGGADDIPEERLLDLYDATQEFSDNLEERLYSRIDSLESRYFRKDIQTEDAREELADIDSVGRYFGILTGSRGKDIRNIIRTYDEWVSEERRYEKRIGDIEDRLEKISDFEYRKQDAEYLMDELKHAQSVIREAATAGYKGEMVRAYQLISQSIKEYRNIALIEEEDNILHMRINYGKMPGWAWEDMKERIAPWKDQALNKVVNDAIQEP